MNTFTYHLRIELDDERQVIPLVDALKVYLNGKLTIHDCLELTTEDTNVAIAIEQLLGVYPELRNTLAPEDGRNGHNFVGQAPLEIGTKDPEIVATYVAPAADLLPAPSSPGLRNCEVCGKEFKPARKDSRFCSKTCQGKSYVAKYRKEKAGRNGNGPSPAAEVAMDSQVRRQTRRWLIEKSGKEVDELGHLLDKGLLAAGDRVHKLGQGWYETFIMSNGALGIRKEKQ